MRDETLTSVRGFLAKVGHGPATYGLRAIRREARRLLLKFEADLDRDAQARERAREAVGAAVESLAAGERREAFQDRKSEAAR